MMGLPSLPRLGLRGHRKCGVEASPGGVRDPDPMGEMLAGAPEPEGIMAPDTEPALLPVVPEVPGLVMIVPRPLIPSWPRLPGPGSMV